MSTAQCYIKSKVSLIKVILQNVIEKHLKICDKK